MRRGQGSLEYLLILAAILAIAVVIVLIANMLLGTPKEANLINQDKYNFATNGWEIRGYDKPITPSDPCASGRMTFVKGGKVYSCNPAAPAAGAEPIGVITDQSGDTHTVYADNDSYYVDVGQKPTCGDGVCSIGEDCCSCCEDCITCATSPIVVKRCASDSDYVHDWTNGAEEKIKMHNGLEGLSKVSLNLSGWNGESDVTMHFVKKDSKGNPVWARDIVSSCTAGEWCDFTFGTKLCFGKDELLVMNMTSPKDGKFTVYGANQGDCSDSDFGISDRNSGIDLPDWAIRLYADCAPQGS